MKSFCGVKCKCPNLKNNSVKALTFFVRFGKKKEIKKQNVQLLTADRNLTLLFSGLKDAAVLCTS